MIEFRSISLSFQDKAIFTDFMAEIKAGEKVSISGPSGRGKSSLLKLVQGYLSPDAGKILIDNEEISQKSIHHLRKKMAWIPQNINLPVNNGQEMVELMDISTNKESIVDYLTKLNLEGDILSKNFSKISGGQKQRIIISIVLSLQKPILLMDEPTSSLDEKSVKRLIELMDSLENTTVLSASHNQTWLDHSDKVIEL